MHWRGEARHWWAQRAGLLAAYGGLLSALRYTEGLLVAAVGAAWFITGATALAKKERLTALAEASSEFLEQILRLLVNTVSFARIGAFALAHAGLSVAIIELAQAGGRVGYWIVLVVGNILVIVLEGVVVSIQTTRLLLFEFFIRFLTGAGRAFKPLPPPLSPRPARKKQTSEVDHETEVENPRADAGDGHGRRGRRDNFAAAGAGRRRRAGGARRRRQRGGAVGDDGGGDRRRRVDAQPPAMRSPRSGALRWARSPKSRSCSAACSSWSASPKASRSTALIVAVLILNRTG